jgi:hypothetical protein
MSNPPEKSCGRNFSIEMKSRNHVKRIVLVEEGNGVLIEGFLGELEDIGMIDGILFEVRGTNGVLRMDLNESDLKKLLVKR